VRHRPIQVLSRSYGPVVRPAWCLAPWILLLAAGLVTTPALGSVSARTPRPDSGHGARTVQEGGDEAAGYEGSRWWDDVEEIEALLQDAKWRRGLRLGQELIGRVVRRSWHEPDLARVLATLEVQRAVAESALGRDDAALWHYQVALNLEASAVERLERYGEEADPLRGVSLREQGRLPDGSTPPVRFVTPGYEPVQVVRPPSTGDFANVQAPHERFPSVTVEVVVDEGGTVRFPVVLSPWVNPVVIHWTLERIRTADYEIRPARVDGEPILSLEEIEMEFEQTSRW
jgi:hypothetical protein